MLSIPLMTLQEPSQLGHCEHAYVSGDRDITMKAHRVNRDKHFPVPKATHPWSCCHRPLILSSHILHPSDRMSAFPGNVAAKSHPCTPHSPASTLCSHSWEEGADSSSTHPPHVTHGF